MRLRPRKEHINQALRLAALLLLAPLVAAAQAPEAAPSVTQTVFQWLNFALIIGAGWWAWKRLKVAFARQGERIAGAIAEAEAAHQKAQERLQAAEAKLAGIEAEAAEMRERAKRDSAAEALRIRALAEDEAARVERGAAAEIEAAERAALNRLREGAIAQTIERARALVAERLTPAIDARLLTRFVDSVGRSGRLS